MYTEEVANGGELQMYHKLSTGSPVQVLVNVAGQVSRQVEIDLPPFAFVSVTCFCKWQ